MKFLLGLLFIFSCTQIFAQESVANQTNPPSLKWYQINTPNFRVLYPEGFEAQAQRMANTFETIREPEARTIGTLPKKISVILQNQSTVSNGFVSMMPRRSEFYAMPSQDYNFQGNNDWLTMLASHEYRHMAQYQHATRGFTKFFRYALGFNALAGLSYVAAPQWFWEGDAVATETAFTSSGRGRIPNFDLLLRTNLQEGRTFNYHKQYLESYKNNISNWYVLGYHMVTYLRKRTNDPHIWDKVTARAWNVPFIPFRFSSALHKETGMYVTKLYKEMAADLQKEWKAQQDTLQFTSYEKVNHRTSKAYTDYLYPQELEDGSIVVRKVGIGDIEKLVLLKDGDEKIIYTQGIINESGSQSAVNNRIVWNEYRYDPRWQVRNYSTIVGYDLEMGKQVMNRKGRYASAALSPDGSKIATVETTTDYKTHLVVLDYFNGHEARIFDNPDNDFISMPRWTNDGENIIALVTNKKGKAIASFDFQSGVKTFLTDLSNENIGYPVPYKNYILYNSPVSGIDNIYAIDVNTKQRFQITCSKYGSYNPTVSKDGKWIYYNEQNRDGLDVVKIPFDTSSWKTWTQTVQSKNDYNILVEQENNPDLFKNIPQKQYETKRYYRWKGMINPYAWGPIINTSLTSAFVGVSSQDMLSTTTISGGYTYDRNEKTGSWGASVSYQGWYPIINVSASLSDRKVNEGNVWKENITGIKPNYDTTFVKQNLTFSWKEKNLEAGLSVPLITTTSKYYGNITFGNSVGITQVSNFTNSINNSRIIPSVIVNDTIKIFYFLSNYVGNGNLLYNHFSLSAYRLLKQSRRDINSKWGQELFLNIYNTPYGGNYNGAQFSFYGVLLFPGLAKHHSLWGYWGYQNSKVDNQFYYANRAGTAVADNYNYQFRNQIPLPRGGLGISRFQNFYSMSGNYTLPVWYPDIVLGPILNIQRMRANLFYDYGFGQTDNQPGVAYNSTGIEVKFDVNVMRLLPQLDVGFRYSIGLQPSTTLFEVLIGSINF